MNIDNLKNKKLIFVQGKKDTIIIHSDTDEFVQKLYVNGLDTKLITIENAGHGDDLEDKSVGKLLEIL